MLALPLDRRLLTLDQIDRIFWPTADNNALVKEVETLLSLAFEPEHFKLPEFQSLSALAQTWWRGQRVCFEELLTLVPRRLHTRSAEEWDGVRDLAWYNTTWDNSVLSSAKWIAYDVSR